jgi:hypothetical protein
MFRDGYFFKIISSSGGSSDTVYNIEIKEKRWREVSSPSCVVGLGMHLENDL